MSIILRDLVKMASGSNDSIYYIDDFTHTIKRKNDSNIEEIVENNAVTTKIENNSGRQDYISAGSFGQNNNSNIDNNTIKEYINKNVFKKAIIILNMDKKLCTNKTFCYLRFDFLIDSSNIYKTIYVKYNNNNGLLNKILYEFSIDNNDIKLLLANSSYSHIKITAYQLSDCSDNNPYIIGNFKFDNMENLIVNNTDLYKILEISSIYSFEFDDIFIYPTKVNGKIYNNKDFSDYLTIKDAQIIITDQKPNIIFNYILNHNYISNNILKSKSICINIDNDEMWDNYYQFNCNIVFYTKTNSYVLTDIVFNKLENTLVLSEDVTINDFNTNDIIKFSITYIEGVTSTKKDNLNNIKLSKYGNIII